jgi:hypothetical protein
MLFRRLLFDHVTACCLYCRWGSEEACCRWKAGVAATEKNRRIAIDEELLITGVSVSEENQRVLNDGVSASWMNDERLLANGVSTTRRRNNCWTELFRR